MHIHIDMVGGIAGDMFLAAAIDAGLVDVPALEAALSTLGVGDIRIRTERVRRGALSGIHVRFEGWDPAQESDHRHLSTILEMLAESGLPKPVEQRACAMFERLGGAESKVHDIPMERVHFHECGALDSIFDFVAAAWIIEESGASWSVGPVPTGSGSVVTDHGRVPVPVPATVELLVGFDLVPREVEAELVTPTGAAILASLRDADPELARPAGRARAVGYGCGTRDLAAFANVVRLLVVDEAKADAPEASSGESSTVLRMACEIDDMNPEWFGDVEARLFEAGALDVHREAIWMKKGRQATRLVVLGRPEDEAKLAACVFTHTTTFGLRVEELRRLELSRRTVEVDTPYGAVPVKLGYWQGALVNASPEYEACARLAEEAGCPVRLVDQAARQAAASLEG